MKQQITIFSLLFVFSAAHCLAQIRSVIEIDLTKTSTENENGIDNPQSITFKKDELFIQIFN